MIICVCLGPCVRYIYIYDMYIIIIILIIIITIIIGLILLVLFIYFLVYLFIYPGELPDFAIARIEAGLPNSSMLPIVTWTTTEPWKASHGDVMPTGDG